MLVLEVDNSEICESAREGVDACGKMKEMLNSVDLKKEIFR